MVIVRGSRTWEERGKTGTVGWGGGTERGRDKERRKRVENREWWGGGGRGGVRRQRITAHPDRATLVEFQLFPHTKFAVIRL